MMASIVVPSTPKVAAMLAATNPAATAYSTIVSPSLRRRKRISFSCVQNAFMIDLREVVCLFISFRDWQLRRLGAAQSYLSV